VWPQYQHVAVIVTEEITARFFNVISLFNGFIPLIAIQASAIEVGSAVTLVFTTVLDRMTLGIEEDEEKDEPTDRAYWLTRASAETMGITEAVLKIVQEVDPGISSKYNRHYIGIARAGVAGNTPPAADHQHQPRQAPAAPARTGPHFSPRATPTRYPWLNGIGCCAERTTQSANHADQMARRASRIVVLIAERDSRHLSSRPPPNTSGVATVSAARVRAHIASFANARGRAVVAEHWVGV
jgi:hypothetical protein